MPWRAMRESRESCCSISSLHSLATAYSGPRVQRTAGSKARLAVLETIINVERGEVTGHRPLQSQQTSRGAHQHLASIGRISRPQASGHSLAFVQMMTSAGASGKLSWRVNNYL